MKNFLTIFFVTIALFIPVDQIHAKEDRSYENNAKKHKKNVKRKRKYEIKKSRMRSNRSLNLPPRSAMNIPPY